jgi:hypothetical protein
MGWVMVKAPLMSPNLRAVRTRSLEVTCVLNSFLVDVYLTPPAG